MFEARPFKPKLGINCRKFKVDPLGVFFPYKVLGRVWFLSEGFFLANYPFFSIMYLEVGIKAFQLFKLSKFSFTGEIFLEGLMAAVACA